MKLYVASDNVSTVPSFVLENKEISGVTIRLPISRFLFRDGYNNEEINKLINDIKLINSYEDKYGNNKVVSVGIIFGMFFPVFPDCRYVIIRDAHHQGMGDPQPIRQPVFWDEPYIKRVENFFKWFSDKLKASEVYESIVQMKITGVNEKTEELKASDQNYVNKDYTGAQAYQSAAEIWHSVGYNVSKVKMTIAHFCDLFAELFPDKIIVLPVIGSLSGFPAININGICLARDREDISKEVIEYGVDMYPEIFGCQSSALMVQGGVPKKVSQSGAAAIVYQVERLLYNPDPPFPKNKLEQDAFQMVLENGRNNNGTIVECFINTLRAFPNMHG